MTEFKDLFNLKDELIDTHIVWTPEEASGAGSGWFINITSLKKNYGEKEKDPIFLNSNKELYDNFLKEKIYKPFEEILNSEAFDILIYPLYYLEEDLNGDKKLTLDYMNNLKTIFDGLFFEKVDFNEIPHDIDSYISTLKDVMKKERKVYFDIQQNGQNSKYYGAMIEKYKKSVKEYTDYVDFSTYVENRITYCTKWILASKNLKNFFSKNIDIDDLCKCVGHDKMCLICGKSFFEEVKFFKEQQNGTIGCIIFISDYTQAIKYYRKSHKDYNCKIKCFDGKNIINYSIDNLIKEFDEFLKKHPEIVVEKVDLEKIQEYFDENNIDQSQLDLMSKREYTKFIYNIIDGLKIKEVSKEDYDKNINDYKRQIKETKDQNIKNKLQQQISKMEFLQQNKPVQIVKGYGSFNNYYGYVYSNGYVVLDVILDDVSKSYGNAIYIMPYNKLIEYSKESRRSYIKKKIDVIPIVHRGNWEERLLEKMESLEKLPLEFYEPSIELKSIVNSETLRLLLEQLSNISKNPDEEIKQRIAESIVIDEELKSSDPAPELTRTEEEQLGDMEFELLQESNGQEDFFKLHKLVKEKEIKLKRNPEVSLKTKLRTKDEDGFYHCDLCDSDEQQNTNNISSSKSIRMFESHHIIPISEGGIDNIYNTCCLCPNCHTRIHNYLKFKEKLKNNDFLDDGALNDFMTMAEYGSFLKKVRERISKSTPEYLSKFDELFNPNYKNDNELTNEELEKLYKKEEEYYINNKEQEDYKFLTDWNTPLKK